MVKCQAIQYKTILSLFKHVGDVQMNHIGITMGHWIQINTTININIVVYFNSCTLYIKYTKQPYRIEMQFQNLLQGILLEDD